MSGMLQIRFYLNESPRTGDMALRVLHELAAQGAVFRLFGPGSEYDVTRRYVAGGGRDLFPFHLDGGDYTLALDEPAAAILMMLMLDAPDPDGNRRLAARALRLAESLVPLCDARFAFLDFQGMNEPPADEMAAGGLPTLFWANFYGPAAVERWGRDLLLGAPGWKKAELAGGAVEYVLTEEPSESADPAFDAAVQDWFAPRLQIERYEALPID